MPVPIQRLLDKHGLDPESLKKAFDSKTLAAADGSNKTKKLVNQIGNTIREGIRRNRQDYRLFKAMDWAYDSPFYQVSYTQLRGLISNQPDEAKVMQTINSWGLTHMLPIVTKNGETCCEADGKTPKRALNLPIFFNIFVPIVMSYIGIRWAKIFNDFNLTPHFKYEPAQFTKEDRVRCEVITQAVQKMSTWFDYPADTKQSILQTLMYGVCINFPREAWYSEKQENEEGEKKTVREGIRFNIPHPSRMYTDLYHRMSSLNSNSGCKHVGYWELCRYSDVKGNELYWNKEKITFGGLEFELAQNDFLSQVFPCTMTFPDGVSSCGGKSGGSGDLDRESDAANSYGEGDSNAATLLTQHFACIIPKDHGLGTYDCPVWFRFVMQSDTTVLWAEPLAYDVFPTYAYDADFNRSRFRSLALEIMPFQDQVSNILTNWIAATKENLQNPIFYDEEKIPVELMSKLENLGFKEYGRRVFVPFKSTVNYKVKTDQREAFYSPQLTRHNTGELATLVSGVLNMLDRIMQLSPQEVGQAAPHEQTAEETKVIAGNTSTRVTFTSSFIHSGNYAKKKMLYDAMMAYADDEITVGITSAWASTEEEFDALLKKVGLEISDGSKFDPQNPDLVHKVKAKKSAMQLESFASTRDGADRIDNPAIADAMSKVFGAVANNPLIIQSIGAPQLIELLNQIIQTSGLPKEFKLRGANVKADAAPEEQQAQVQQTLAEFANKVKEAISQSQQETLAAAGQQTEQVIAQLTQQITQQLTPLAQAVQQIPAIAQAVEQGAQTNQVQDQQIQQIAESMKAITVAVEQVAMPMQPLTPEAAPVPPML